MKLNVLERIVSLSVLTEYKEGNFITFKMISELKNKLTVSEQEIKDFDLKIDGNNYTWNHKGNKEVDIDITEGEKNLIKDLLIAKDKDNKLLEQHVNVYKKFVLE